MYFLFVSLRHYWALDYAINQAPHAFSLLQSPFLIFLLLLIFLRLFQVTSANYLNLLLCLSHVLLLAWNSACVALFEWGVMISSTWEWDSHGSLLPNTVSFCRHLNIYMLWIFYIFPCISIHSHIYPVCFSLTFFKCFFW